MLSNTRFSILAAGAAVALAAFAVAPLAHASIIVSDNFNNNGSPYPNGTSLAGLKPDLADLPGTSYSVYTSNSGFPSPSIDTSAGNPAPSANTGFSGATYINIASANSYTLPASVTFSADIQINTLQMNSGNNFRGVGVGFSDAVQTSGSGDSSSTFTGLVVNPDGTLRLLTAGYPGAGVGSTIYDVAPFSGFNAGNFYNLTYTVNLTTGSITNVNFNGNNDTAAFSGVTGLSGLEFTSSSPTVLAGFYGSTDVSANDFGRVDNFSVSTVPEPATLGLFAMGGLGLLLLKRRRIA